jgi:hypothetical protein
MDNSEPIQSANPLAAIASASAQPPPKEDHTQGARTVSVHQPFALAADGSRNKSIA